jgi:hypothetical protein
MIFKFLDPVTAACLGITCKAYRNIYKTVCKGIKVPLDSMLLHIDGGPAILKNLLKRCQGDLMYGLQYNDFNRKFIRKEAYPTIIKSLEQKLLGLRLKVLRNYEQNALRLGNARFQDKVREKLLLLGEVPHGLDA